ncbi:MAG TPA: hypothetical protein VFM55_03940 [Micromonosporaceae bacterium]|nr:hypothetical protein [Micromonosporaceae bacterium]
MWLQATLTAGYPLLTRLPDSVVGTTTEQDAGGGALFALVPIRPGAEEYLLKTGVLGPAGEPECVTLDGDRVVIAACDVGRQQQIVTLRGNGPPFKVLVGGRALSVTQAEVRAVAPGSGTPLTFIVRGTAQDPFG